MTSSAEIARYEGIVRVVCRSYYRAGANQRGDLDDDLLQEARIAVWQALEQFDASVSGPSEESRGRWIAFVVRRAVITAVIASRRKRTLVLTEASRLDQPTMIDGEASDDLTLADSVSDPSADVWRIVDARDALDRVMAAGYTDVEALALQHLLAGSTYQAAGEEFAGGSKSFDNAAQRVKRKARRAVTDAGEVAA